MEQVKRKRTRTRTYPNFLEFLKAQTKRLRKEVAEAEERHRQKELAQLEKDSETLWQARVLAEVK